MRGRHESHRGSVMMETVIALPILLFLIFLIIQFAQIWTARQMVSYAAFCATRAVVVVPRAEQQAASENAARMALSWLCPAGNSENSGRCVTVPGWGRVGSRAMTLPWNSGGRVGTILQSRDYPAAAVTVRFRYPLMISAFAVNKILGNFANADRGYLFHQAGQNDFAANLDDAARGAPTDIDGWPYVTLTETCVLPMPYSTANFPTGAFSNHTLTGGN